MADPVITVSITGYQFSIGEIQDFLDTARSIDGMATDADVYVYVECEPHDGLGAVLHTLNAATTGSKQ